MGLNIRFSVIDYWQWAIGYWLLAMGYWLLAIGNGLLDIGYWQWVSEIGCKGTASN